MRPFECIKVIDLSHVLAGPFAAYQLGVLGAEVIKIENPSDPDMARNQGSDRALNDIGMGTNFLAQGSNKRTMTLDLSRTEGRDILKRLVAGADVLVENYRPGALKGLGLGYDDLVQINPRLIYCSISGFGQHGPRAGQRAYDHVIQALSGAMAANGDGRVPTRIGFPAFDYATGTMAAFAISASLFQRERTGRSQHIDLSMLDVALTTMSSVLTASAWSGKDPVAPGNGHALAGNCAFPSADGMIMFGANDCKQHRLLFELMEEPEIAARNDWNSRLDYSATDKAALEKKAVSRTAQDWEDYLQAGRVPAGRVRPLGEALADPQLESRDILHVHVTTETLTRPLMVPKCAFVLEHGGARIDSPPAPLGAHTDAVLQELGFNDAEIAALRTSRVV